MKENISPDMARDQKSVHQNCGYCAITTCDNTTLLDCLLCDNFVTTLNRLPYFEEQIKILNQKIINEQIPHEKEDLINIKRLHVGYISEILKLKNKKGL